MRSTILSTVALLGYAFADTGALGDAPVTNQNLANIAYQAVLPTRNTTGLRGQITGVSGSNGTGVNFNINFYGFPDASQGPFIYHIHDQPVPADGNCTKTLAHLDPFQRGEVTPCDKTQPQTCQVGDLSGKHGNITSDPFQATYLDLYLTTTSGPGAFFGNRSIVIHNQNKTRLTCANFTMVSSGYGGPNASATSTATIPVYTGAATAITTSAGVVGAAVFALMALAL